jgi:PAS domain S-box-containing protein
MTGYDAEEVIGKSPKCFKDPILTEELVKLGHALKNWESHEMTTLNYKKNGEEFWVNFALTPVADEKAGIRIGLL